MSSPSHHRPNGRFENPWPMAAGDAKLRRSAWRFAGEWFTEKHPPDPSEGSLPLAVPAIAGVGEVPAVSPGGVRVTWVGHATVLVQLPGLNILTDPVWSERCSPVPFLGPKRFVPPPLALDELPTIHAVLLSHDHYDHLDRPTVRALHRRFGDDPVWFTPLGYRRWFADQGVTRVVERDWWESELLPGGAFEAMAVPARHWTRRTPLSTNTRLWCGWVVRPVEVDGHRGSEQVTERSVNFVGDSGYCPAFEEIGSRLGPFDVSLVPIGAYEPRWFMGSAHMNPEEAVRTYRDAGGQGAFVGIHWGTWRLTFEDPLEPPVRTRAAWAAAGFPDADLHLPGHGETLSLP